MRHQLKPKTPSARARMSYILRVDRYGVNQARAAELVAAGVANLPSWASGPEDFWAGTDAFERANARLCLELELNLPHELSRAGQVAAIADYMTGCLRKRVSSRSPGQSMTRVVRTSIVT